MEFPELGKHCSEPSCKLLDFLPMKCDACAKVFCNDHIHYNLHSCTESYKKDNQVPVCPLCNKPIPLMPGETPDVKVGQHIDTDCQSDPAKEKRKIYTNKCSFKGCRQKELIPVQCDKCRKNYCLKHRHEQDHSCAGFQGSGRGVSSAGAAAVTRAHQGSKPAAPKGAPTGRPSAKPQQTTMSNMGRELDRARQNRTTTPISRTAAPTHHTAPASRNIQGNLSEDEAMARAIQMSLADTGAPPTQTNRNTSQEEEDRLLAQALAESEGQTAPAGRRTRSRTSSSSSGKSVCTIS